MNKLILVSKMVETNFFIKNRFDLLNSKMENKLKTIADLLFITYSQKINGIEFCNEIPPPDKIKESYLVVM